VPRRPALRSSVAAAAVLLATVAGVALYLGFGRDGGEHPTTSEAGRMRFVATKPPGSRASRPGPANLLFLSPRVGFAATTGGVQFVAREGYPPPRDRGRIERTDDGGVSWRTLWSGRGVVFGSIAASGRTIVASGVVARRISCCEEPRGPSVLVASADAGRTWQRLAGPRGGGGAIQVVTPRVWVLFRPREIYEVPARPAAGFRSEDAGRHWRRLSLPRRPQLVRFVTASFGFAGARAEICPRGSQLWRTTDGGANWKPVPGTCGLQLTDLDVVSRRVLFAAHSTGLESLRWRSAVRRSLDGGRSWQTLWRERGWRITKVAFVDARRGFVAEDRSGERDFYTRLRATADAGRTWSARTLPYTRFPYSTASSEGPEVPAASAGMRYAWAGDGGAGVVWRTADGARTWRLSSNPRSLDPAPGPTLAARGVVALRTPAGTVSTGDGGRTWALARPPSEQATAVAEGRNAFLAEGRIHTEYGWSIEPAIPTVTADEGKTWRPVRLPRALRKAVDGGAGDAAFTSARDGLVAGPFYDAQLPVFSTHDGGRTWRAVPPPPEPGTDVILGPGIIVLTPDPAALAVTTDEGRTWRSFPVKPESYFCGLSRPTRADIWVMCGDSVGKPPAVTLVTSHDGGRTWTRRTARIALDEELVAVSGSEAWAVSYGDFRAGVPSRLWHTTDGGATWRQAWIRLDPQMRVAQVTTGPSAR
jgi:photosystem II stability/assembly factor-like uncharacterized protein